MKTEILLPHIRNYFQSFLQVLDINTVEYAKLNEIPIVDTEVGVFLQFLLQLHSVNLSLEIGCGIGVSTRYIADSVNGRLISIDYNRQRIEKARLYLKGRENIEFLCIDAEEYLRRNKKKFDFVFVDSVKSRYGILWHLLKNNLNNGALVVFDDILIYGLLGQDKSIVPNKYKFMCSELDSFIKEIVEERVYPFCLVPIGNGLLLIRNAC
jgi:predicted O-methyltransferase YrrM